MMRLGSALAGRTLWLVVAAVGLALSPGSASGKELLPVVFVHGSFGSAQQFETQAMRFTSNGYPQRLLFVFEYDTLQPFSEDGEVTPAGEQVLADLDAFLDEVLAETGAGAVNTIGHSRGTSVMTAYLETVPGGSAKVARYVNIDGREPDELPGGVPTIGIWGEWSSGGEFARPDPFAPRAHIGPPGTPNFYYPDKSHTEVATSAEAFAHMYEFFTGEEPHTTDVVPEPPGRVTIAGRAVIFPQNEGFDGGTVELWRVDAETGQRIGRRPRATFAIDETGDFGPVRVNGRHSYELALVNPTGEVHHFYQEPFARSDHFFRLNSGRPGEGIGAVVPTSDQSTAFVLLRMRELWGDQGAQSDVLEIDGRNVLTPVISPRSGVNLAVFAHDDGLDEATDLGKGILPPFHLVPFITAADIFVPAASPPADTVEVRLHSRGADAPQIVNVPNWPSTTHRITVQFRDYVQDAYRFGGRSAPRGRGR